MKNQRKWIIEQLRANGEITRNQALRNYVSRLGAYICDMRSEGWEIDSFKRDGDHVYKLVKDVKKTQVVEQLPNGQVRVSYI